MEKTLRVVRSREEIQERMPIVDFRLPIVDFLLWMTNRSQSEIGNRQSAIKGRSLRIIVV